MVAGGTLGGVLRHPDPPLSDGVITLRAKARADIPALVAICADPEIPRWTRVPSPYTPEDAGNPATTQSATQPATAPSPPPALPGRSPGTPPVER